jgi:formate-dependent nitrite reductase membrane component NrfD
MAGAVFLGYAPGVLAGFALVLGGIVCLLFHLGHRIRSWRAIAGLAKAWISRGVLFAAGLICFGFYFLLKSSAPGSFASIGVIGFGLLTALYSGFLLASMTAIPFWNSALTPILFLSHSLTTGFAILTLMALGNSETTCNRAALLTLLLAAITLVLTLVHVSVMMRATNAARRSVHLLFSGNLRWTFTGGALLVGLVVPFIIVCWMYLGDAQSMQSATAAMLVAVVLRGIGDYSFKYSVLKAGVFEVLI